MSNFFFSHSVFKRLVPQTRKNQGLFGKQLTKSLLYSIFHLLFILMENMGYYFYLLLKTILCKHVTLRKLNAYI